MIFHYGHLMEEADWSGAVTGVGLLAGGSGSMTLHPAVPNPARASTAERCGGTGRPALRPARKGRRCGEHPHAVVGGRNRGDETMTKHKIAILGASGYTGAELGWTLEDNYMINRCVAAVGARRYKTYRIYEKPLDG